MKSLLIHNCSVKVYLKKYRNILVHFGCQKLRETALSGTWTGLTSINHHESSLIPSLGTKPVKHEIYILYLGTNVALQIYKAMLACHYPNENREVLLLV